MTKLVKTFDEFLIVFSSTGGEYGHTWIHYTVYRIVAHLEDGTPFFNKRGYLASDDQVTQIEDAQITLEGFVKWDGCMEFEILDDVHFCGRRSAHVLTRIIDAIYDTAIGEFGFIGENVE